MYARSSTDVNLLLRRFSNAMRSGEMYIHHIFHYGQLHISVSLLYSILAFAKECGQDLKKIPYKRKTCIVSGLQIYDIVQHMHYF